MNDMQTDKLPSVESLPAANMWNSAMSTCADSFEEWAAPVRLCRARFRNLPSGASRTISDLADAFVRARRCKRLAGQGAWTVRAAEDYSEEAQRLGRLVTSVALFRRDARGPADDPARDRLPRAAAVHAGYRRLRI